VRKALFYASLIVAIAIGALAGSLIAEVLSPKNLGVAVPLMGLGAMYLLIVTVVAWTLAIGKRRGP
jgi:hypothetical protein